MLLVAASQSWAQGPSAVTMNVNVFAMVRVNTGTFSLTPTQAELDADWCERLGALSIDARTNNDTGCTVKVSGEAAGTGKINPSDFLIKSATTGSTITAYTAITTLEQNLWSVAAKKANYGTAPSPILIDVKIQNVLTNYTDGTYTNTLTFTVVTN
jgi:hypothetical protein